MKLLLVALCVVVCGCLSVRADAKCGAIERFKVHHQWKEAFGTGDHRLEFGVTLFRNLFQDFPAYREMFAKARGDNIYSAEFESKVERILASLDNFIDLLDDEPTLQAQLAHKKVLYVENKVDPKYFDSLRDEILRTLPKYLGTRLDWDAWSACLNYIFSGLKE